MPARFAWMGTVNPIFDNAANWRNLDTGLTATAPPAPGDSLTFDDAYSNPPCFGLHGFGAPLSVGDFASVRLLDGYAGMVTAIGTFSTQTFTLQSGIIAQGGSSANISAISTFTWTGGVLNGTPSDATVNVMGSGSITLPTGGTLACGSTLNFSNPAAAAVETVITGAGTLLLNGGNGIYVGADAKVKQQSANGGENMVETVNGVRTLTLDFGGEYGYVGNGTYTSGLRVINNGGRFYLNGQAQVSLTGGDANTPAYTQNSNWLFPPKLEIQNGCVRCRPKECSHQQWGCLADRRQLGQVPAIIKGTFTMSEDYRV